MSIPVPIHDSKGWGIDSGWGSNYSSQTGSPDQPPSSLLKGVDYFSLAVVQTKAADPSPTLPKRPPDIDRKPVRRPGPSYIGPKLNDPDETSDEEADFEKFKMQTRIAKIFEFHRDAAQADIDLALNIHNDRKAKKSSKDGDARKVREHEKQMLLLQAKKEEERKTLVEEERGKRRSEIRKRSALREPARAANTTAVHQSWDTLFDSQSVRLDIDGNGKLLLRPEGTSEDDSENQMWDLNSAALDLSRMAPNMLRGRKPSIGQSGWKSTPTPSAQTPWPTTSAATPIPDRKPEQPSWFSDSAHPLSQSISFDDHDFQIPGGFQGEAKATPVPVASGWAKKAIPVAAALGKLSPPAAPSSTTAMPVETKPVPVAVPAPIPAATTPTPASLKKQNKKQRPNAKKPAIATATSSKVEVEASSTEHELEMSSTPRPSIPHMMKSFKTDDISSTPRPSTLKHLVEPSAAGNSAVEEESPWDRVMKRKASESENAKPLKASLYATDVGESPWAHAEKQKAQFTEPRQEDSPWTQTMRQKPTIQEPQVSSFSASLGMDEETPWQRMMRQKAPEPTLSQLKATPYAAVEEEETLWAKAMKHKLQGPNALNPRVPQTIASKVALEEESPWERMMKQNKLPGINALVTPAAVPVIEPEETPWERIKRLNAQGSDNVASTSSKAKVDQTSNLSTLKFGQRAANPNMWTPSEVPDSALPASKLVPPQSRPNEDKFWTPGGGAPSMSQHQSWDPLSSQLDKSYATPSQHQHVSDAQRSRQISDPVSTNSRGFGTQTLEVDKRQIFLPTSIMKGSKAKKPVKGKRVTMEEVPDEEGPDGRKAPDAKLPSNSRVILDIVEPKPSVPSTMFTNIFQYGEDEEEEEDEYTESSSMAPTPSTAPTSPPGEVPTMNDEWLSSMAEDIKNGDWDRLLDTSVSESTAKAMYSPWAQGFHHNESPGAHDFDSAKLFSALASVDDKPPPPAVMSSKPAASPPRPAVVEKKVPEAKVPAKKEPEKKEPEKKEPEKKETVGKPPPAKETKAKGKAKGKGRK
jgi:hypothetical protein